MQEILESLNPTDLEQALNMYSEKEKHSAFTIKK